MLKTSYTVRIEKRAFKQFQKLDPSVRKYIRLWIENNLQGTVDPRRHGKQLSGELTHLWRYRVGSYRVLAEINNDEVMIIIVSIAHRGA